MRRVKSVRITYMDGSIDTFHEDDYPNGYEDKYHIRREDWLGYGYAEGGTLLRLDTHNTHTLIPTCNIKRTDIEEKE